MERIIVFFYFPFCMTCRSYCHPSKRLRKIKPSNQDHENIKINQNTPGKGSQWRGGTVCGIHGYDHTVTLFNDKRVNIVNKMKTIPKAFSELNGGNGVTVGTKLARDCIRPFLNPNLN